MNLQSEESGNTNCEDSGIGGTRVFLNVERELEPRTRRLVQNVYQEWLALESSP